MSYSIIINYEYAGTFFFKEFVLYCPGPGLDYIFIKRLDVPNKVPGYFFFMTRFGVYYDGPGKQFLT